MYSCAEAKQDLASYVDLVRDLVSDPEKSLTKEEKVTSFLHQVSTIFTCIIDFTLMINNCIEYIL